MTCSRSTGMSNSVRSRWKLTEQTMIRVRINLVPHTQCSNKTSMTQRQESLIRAKPGHWIHLELEKLKMAFRSRSPHGRTILKDCATKCKVATKKYRVSIKTRFTNLKHNSLRDTKDNTVHMVFEGEPAVKLYAKNIEVGTSALESSDRTKSLWGGFTLGSTNH